MPRPPVPPLADFVAIRDCPAWTPLKILIYTATAIAHPHIQTLKAYVIVAASIRARPRVALIMADAVIDAHLHLYDPRESDDQRVGKERHVWIEMFAAVDVQERFKALVWP
jgi:hypothetical protein